MTMIRRLFILAALFAVQGCMAASWDVRQVETTFVNQENNQDYVQKNAVLLDRKTGQSWILSSDVDSNYFWLKLPVKDDNESTAIP